jgi:hypothetical protein
MTLLLAGGKTQPLHRAVAAAAASCSTPAWLAGAAGTCLAKFLLFLWWQHPLMLLQLPGLPGACRFVCMLLVRAGPKCLLLSMRWLPLLGLLLAICRWRGLWPRAALLVRLLPLLLVLLLRLPHATLLPLVFMLASLLLLLLPLVLLLLVISVSLATLLLLLLLPHAWLLPVAFMLASHLLLLLPHIWLLPVVLSLLPTSGRMLLLFVLLLVCLCIFKLLQLCIDMLLQLILRQHNAAKRAALRVARCPCCCLVHCSLPMISSPHAWLLLLSLLLPASLWCCCFLT